MSVAECLVHISMLWVQSWNRRLGVRGGRKEGGRWRGRMNNWSQLITSNTLNKYWKSWKRYRKIHCDIDNNWQNMEAKVIIDTEDLNGTINLYEESDIYITFHTTTIQHTLFKCTWKKSWRQTICQDIKQVSINLRVPKTYKICSLPTVELN